MDALKRVAAGELLKLAARGLVTCRIIRLLKILNKIRSVVFFYHK
jgi:hypothetical protein